MKLTKAVNANELERLTRDGWQVIDRIDHAQRIETTRLVLEEGHEAKDANGYYKYIQPKRGERADLVVDPLFVLEKDAEQASVEQALRLELDRVSMDLTGAQKHIETLEKNYAEANKKLNEAELACKVKADLLKDTERSNTELRAKVKQLEADFEKIRKEVGEGRWRAISQEMGLISG